jgi:hypothetical protein
MTNSRVLTGILSTVFFLTLVSTARADVVRADMFLEKLIYAERHNLIDLDFESAGINYLYAGHFENNNGKHLGFSVAAINRGPRLGIVRQGPPPAVQVTQSPEPTAMVLLGTGLAAVAALARRRARSRSVR